MFAEPTFRQCCGRQLTTKVLQSWTWDMKGGILSPSWYTGLPGSASSWFCLFRRNWLSGQLFVVSILLYEVCSVTEHASAELRQDFPRAYMHLCMVSLMPPIQIDFLRFSIWLILRFCRCGIMKVKYSRLSTSHFYNVTLMLLELCFILLGTIASSSSKHAFKKMH